MIKLAGNQCLGGEDFDKAIIDKVAAKLQLSNVTVTANSLHRLCKLCKWAKEKCTSCSDTEDIVVQVGGIGRTAESTPSEKSTISITHSE